MQILKLKPHEERRLRAGHPWVFSNEVDTGASPLSGFEAGEPAEIHDSGGRCLGTGYVNPHSLICARLVSRKPSRPLSADLIARRMEEALALRRRLYETPYYRLVYAESDSLPGLVIDRYGGHVVIQITTAGMERMRDAIVSSVDNLLSPESILMRNELAVRELEGLSRYSETVKGKTPESVVVPEHGSEFEVALAGGQKTGWFFDQSENRDRVARFAKGHRVLDVFSYVGAWGILAVRGGAESALCVDESGSAVELVRRNAERNAVAGRVEARRDEAFRALKSLGEAGERFGTVVLDPPAFIKRKRDAKNGIQAYRRINKLGIRLIQRDGILVSCSCSYHLGYDTLARQIREACRASGRRMQIIATGSQSPDHPVHPAVPESAYLKCIVARVI
ncbi:MAG: class I SAM-dependent rRNA methyltransferase [Pseudomonadota bacterium]|nr:class I SAM-dependent rRNA methyltransferase [Pseudomonadota bacterium]